MGGRGVTRIYASPTTRTMSTAAALAEELGIKQVTPVFLLNCCAMAHKIGVAHKTMMREPTRETLRNTSCSCWPPMGDAREIDQFYRQRHDDSFVRAVEAIGDHEEQDSTIVLVSHREGIYQLQDCLRMRRTRVPYCFMVFLQYSHTSKKVSLSPMHSQVPQEDDKKEMEEFKRILWSGSGRVVVHRDGAGGWNQTVLRTVPGGPGGPHAVQDAERVELCSVPQPAEGEDEEFVLVKCSHGRKGWLKVTYVHPMEEAPLTAEEKQKLMEERRLKWEAAQAKKKEQKRRQAERRQDGDAPMEDRTAAAGSLAGRAPPRKDRSAPASSV
mmetsp:Transcript_71397/g.133539  ORF Transcript_71397/g.133539 Transcript_71397/m.133539 type:complete len:327 (+) Transcript_71397:138-1118(+)